METAMLAERARDGHRGFNLPGLVVSPYFQPRATRGIGIRTTGRDTNIFPACMILNAKIVSYSLIGTTLKVQVLFQSDDGSILDGETLVTTVNYGDSDATVKTTSAATVTTFCTSNSLPAPVIEWLVAAPSDITAAIPAAPSSYQTIVSQTGTAAPAVSGSFSPMSTYPAGTTFAWARTGAGVYTLTASTAVFNTSGKTGVFVAPLQNLNASVKAVVTSSTVITITTAVQSVAVLGLLGLTTTNTDALLSQTMFYVQTYS